MNKKIIAISLVLLLTLTFSANTLAMNQAVRGVKVYGGSSSKIVVNSGSRQFSDFTMTIYGDSNFSSEANMTFRCYKEDDSSATRSNAISFKLNEYYSGQSITKPYINGGAAASYLDIRGSIPNSNSTAYALFYGYVKM
ncbi:MAG: hypothetical protein RR224_03355 [Clostridia bacterium]